MEQKAESDIRSAFSVSPSCCTSFCAAVHNNWVTSPAVSRLAIARRASVPIPSILNTSNAISSALNWPFQNSPITFHRTPNGFGIASLLVLISQCGLADIDVLTELIKIRKRGIYRGLGVRRGRPRKQQITRAVEMRQRNASWRAIYAALGVDDVLDRGRLRGAVYRRLVREATADESANADK